MRLKGTHLRRELRLLLRAYAGGEASRGALGLRANMTRRPLEHYAAQLHSCCRVSHAVQHEAPDRGLIPMAASTMCARD